MALTADRLRGIMVPARPMELTAALPHGTMAAALPQGPMAVRLPGTMERVRRRRAPMAARRPGIVAREAPSVGRVAVRRPGVADHGFVWIPGGSCDWSCGLFQWIPTPRAAAIHEALARRGILTRLFTQVPFSRLPGSAEDRPLPADGLLRTRAISSYVPLSVSLQRSRIQRCRPFSDLRRRPQPQRFHTPYRYPL